MTSSREVVGARSTDRLKSATESPPGDLTTLLRPPVPNCDLRPINLQRDRPAHRVVCRVVECSHRASGARQGSCEGTRVLSVYTLPTGVKLWIITEWDRSCTTILRPEEY